MGGFELSDLDLRQRLIQNLEVALYLMERERHYEAYSYLFGMRSAISDMDFSGVAVLDKRADALRIEEAKLKKREDAVLEKEQRASDLERKAKKKYLEALAKEKEAEGWSYKVPKTPTPHKNKSKKLDDFLDRQDANRNHWGQ